MHSFWNKVSSESIRRMLRKSGYSGRIPRKKPFIKWIMQNARQTWIKYFEFWKRVVFNTFECDVKGKVWRKAGKELNPKNISQTVKYDKVSVIVRDI